MSVEKYRDFLDYWDSRFDENEKILNNYPQLANFTFRECNRVWNMLIHDYAALLSRHNALVEVVHKAMDRTVGCDKKQTDEQIIADIAYLKRLASDYFKTSIDCGNRALSAERKYDALREAVAWERECCQDIRPLVAWARLYMLHGEDYVDAVAEALREIQDAARAEVDRLISGTPAPETQEKPC